MAMRTDWRIVFSEEIMEKCCPATIWDFLKPTSRVMRITLYTARLWFDIVTGQLSLFPLCNILLSLRGSRKVSFCEENALLVKYIWICNKTETLLKRLLHISPEIISIVIISCFAEKVFEIFLMAKLEKPIERAKTIN